MEINQFSQNTAQTTGLESSAFGFEMNAKMYSIMVDKLYTDKTGAIIRELSCNALDAHVESGCTDVPFELHLPTWLDKTFYIRDFGTGIPHEKFEEIYTNIGASTKEGSNDQIGGYGLGSKTPFTVVDTYVIENWNEGRKTTWACFKSEGFPQVTRVGDERSSEPSGLKVSFSFTTDLVNEFTRSVEKQLKFFQTKPTLTGNQEVEWATVPDYTGKTYFYYEDKSANTYYNSVGSVLMGDVCYPFDLDSLGDHNIPREVVRQPLCLVVPIGAIDIPPSRESLEYTDKTKKYLIKELSGIREDYRKEFEAGLLKMETLATAKDYIRQGNTGLLKYDYSRILEYNYNKDSEAYSVLSQPYMNCKYPLLQVNRYSRSGTNSSSALGLDTVLSNEYDVYVNDLGKGKVAHFKDNKTKVNKNDYIVEGCSSVKRDALDTHVLEVIKWFKDTYDMDIKKLSDVVGFPVLATPVKRKTGTYIKPDQVYKAVHRKAGKHHTLNWFRDPNTKGLEEMPKTGYYLVVKGSKFETPDDLPLLEYVLDRMPEHEVYLVRASSEKKIPNTLKPLSELHTTAKATVDPAILEERRALYLRFKLDHGVNVTQEMVDLLAHDPKVRVLQRWNKFYSKKAIARSRYYHHTYRYHGSIHQYVFAQKHRTEELQAEHVDTPADALLIARVKELGKHVSSKYGALNCAFNSMSNQDRKESYDLITTLSNP